MSVWEYKVISSGKGGFATPALMESFLNQLGKEEWEIIHFHTPADNALAFSGLARRSTQRDWTLEDAVATAARAEAEKLRTEFEAKFKGMGGGGPAPIEDKPESLAAEKADADEGFRKLRDTERDQEHQSDDEHAAEGEPDDWQKLAKEEELPSFFEAIQPLMRRNQRGAGMSVGVDHLAKKWGLGEDDIMGALKECGFAIPRDEDETPEYLEYDGDLFWVNVNRRGEIWVNTKEKPRPVFKAIKAARFTPEVKEGAVPEGGADSPSTLEAEPSSAPKSPDAPESSDRPERGERADRPERQNRNNDRGERGDKPRQNDQSSGGGNNQNQNQNKRGLPEGQDLLNRIKPMMRRARGGEGGSGSVGFLSRGLKCRENDLMAAFNGLGLTLAGAQGESAPEVVIGDNLWWLNKDHRGGVWINARKPGTEKVAGSEGSAPAGQGSSSGSGDPAASARVSTSSPVPGSAEDPGMTSEAPSMPSPESAVAPAAESAPTLEPQTAQSAQPATPVPDLIAQLRPLLKETRTGTLAGEVGKLAEGTNQSREALLASLVSLGLTLPEKPKEKPATIDFGGEPVWLSKNAKDELYFNAKPYREAAPEKKPRKPKRAPEAEPASESPASSG